MSYGDERDAIVFSSHDEGPIYPMIATTGELVGSMKLLAFLLEQVGGSVVLTMDEYATLVYSNKMIYSYRDGGGNYVLKVE